MYIKRPMEFVKNYDSIQVQISPLKEKPEDADEWEVSPVVIDEVEVS